MNTTNYNINFFKLKISTERKGENSVRRFQDFRVSNGQQFSFSYRKYPMSVYPSYKYDFSKARSSSQAPSQVTWYHFAHSLHVTHSTSSEVICFFARKTTSLLLVPMYYSTLLPQCCCLNHCSRKIQLTVSFSFFSLFWLL